jgi:ADP-ribose pyrophosphatase
MSHEDMQAWEEISRELVFDTFIQIEKVSYRLPSGEKKDIFIKKTKSATAVLALTKNNEVILVRQYRPGPNEILLELPGGYIDENESPLTAAARELLEETGYKAGNIELVTYVFDDAYTTMSRAAVVATDCIKVSDQSLDESEFIDVVLVSLSDFRKLLQSGRMTDVEVGYLGLDFLMLF